MGGRCSSRRSVFLTTSAVYYCRCFDLVIWNLPSKWTAASCQDILPLCEKVQLWNNRPCQLRLWLKA
jgi:hypothetical protein